jgi:hypothetical protein
VPVVQLQPWKHEQNVFVMRSALFWDITRRHVVIVYRRFGTTYRSHLYGSEVRIGKKERKLQAWNKIFFWYSSRRYFTQKKYLNASCVFRGGTYYTLFHDAEGSVAAALEVRAAAMVVITACRKLKKVQGWGGRPSRSDLTKLKWETHKHA